MSTHRVSIQSSSFLPRWSQGPARDCTQAIERLLRTEESEFPISTSDPEGLPIGISHSTHRESVSTYLSEPSHNKWIKCYIATDLTQALQWWGY